MACYARIYATSTLIQINQKASYFFWHFGILFTLRLFIFGKWWMWICCFCFVAWKQRYIKTVRHLQCSPSARIHLDPFTCKLIYFDQDFAFGFWSKSPFGPVKRGLCLHRFFQAGWAHFLHGGSDRWIVVWRGCSWGNILYDSECDPGRGWQGTWIPR